MSNRYRTLMMRRSRDRLSGSLEVEGTFLSRGGARLTQARGARKTLVELAVDAGTGPGPCQMHLSAITAARTLRCFLLLMSGVAPWSISPSSSATRPHVGGTTCAALSSSLPPAARGWGHYSPSLERAWNVSRRTVHGDGVRWLTSVDWISQRRLPRYQE